MLSGYASTVIMFFYSFSAGTAFRRQNLMSKDGPRAEGVLTYGINGDDSTSHFTKRISVFYGFKILKNYST